MEYLIEIRLTVETPSAKAVPEDVRRALALVVEEGYKALQTGVERSGGLLNTRFYEQRVLLK